MKAGLVLAVLLGLVATGPAFPAGEGGYRVLAGRDCGGFPRVAADTARGLCLGLVWQDADHSGTLRLPRDLAPLGGGAWLVTDLGAWDRARGAVWRLTATLGEPPRLERVLGDLETPHTILLGPGGAYVGEMGRIVVFDPNAADPAASLKVVVSDLPANRLHDNRHPLSAFVFGADGSLLVNVGAPSDQCLGPDGAPAGARCEEGEGPQAQAVVRRYPLASPGRWDPRYSVFASGLRNSVAMTIGPSGDLLQAENSIDLAEAGAPYDEINVLKPGRHYGWPYCLNRRTPAPGWAKAAVMDCASPGHAGAAVLLPPHSAPLAILHYDRAALPGLKGKVVVGFHGYRGDRTRLAAYALTAGDVPTGKPLVLWRWDGKTGPRPRPAGVRLAPDGSLWIADDRNRAILRLAAG
jgi:glucose/arabinose dehydrogenase